MHHIAILKKSWKLLPLIVNGTKTVESRWYKSKRAPWGKINAEDTIYFKDVGCKVSMTAMVKKVEHYEVSSDVEAKKLMQKYVFQDIGQHKITPELLAYISGKRYAIFIFLDQPKVLNHPFDITKKGFGMQSAWLCVKNIKQVAR